MVVEKGSEWGIAGSPPPATRVVHSDLEAGRLVGDALRSGEDPPALLLRGGDLFRTLGGRTGQETHGMRFLIDVGKAQHDGRTDYFVAHLIARGSWWWGRVVAVMNAEFRETWKVAPRAHPGDGLLDVLDADPSMGQRLAARRRLVHGDHVPHPDIAVSRVGVVELTFDSPVTLWFDAHRAGKTTRVEAEVLPECLEVYL